MPKNETNSGKIQGQRQKIELVDIFKISILIESDNIKAGNLNGADREIIDPISMSFFFNNNSIRLTSKYCYPLGFN